VGLRERVSVMALETRGAHSLLWLGELRLERLDLRVEVEVDLGKIQLRETSAGPRGACHRRLEPVSCGAAVQVRYMQLPHLASTQ
jgi:hypothetical protein